MTEIDLSHNDVADTGVQHLVAALCDPAVLPSLQTVRLYKNKLTALGPPPPGRCMGEGITTL